MISHAYLGLGSNLGKRESNIGRALELLRQISLDLKVSSLYETTPQGFRDQPLFLNAVCKIETKLGPFELMHEIKLIENSKGRHRSFINAPRTLDIDILLFGNQVLNTPHLVVPHPRFEERAFVLEPLAEIEPTLRHPVTNETVKTLLGKLKHGGVFRRGWHLYKTSS